MLAHVVGYVCFNFAHSTCSTRYWVLGFDLNVDRGRCDCGLRHRRSSLILLDLASTDRCARLSRQRRRPRLRCLRLPHCDDSGVRYWRSSSLR